MESGFWERHCAVVLRGSTSKENRHLGKEKKKKIVINNPNQPHQIKYALWCDKWDSFSLCLYYGTSNPKHNKGIIHNLFHLFWDTNVLKQQSENILSHQSLAECLILMGPLAECLVLREEF